MLLSASRIVTVSLIEFIVLLLFGQCSESVSHDTSVYNVYSDGDGVILQHDARQMDKPAVRLDYIISITNSSVRSPLS